MKKFVAVVMTLMMLLSAFAVAEEAAQTTTDRILDEVEILSQDDLTRVMERIIQFEESTGVVFWVQLSTKAASTDKVLGVVEDSMDELVDGLDLEQEDAMLLYVGMNLGYVHMMAMGRPDDILVGKGLYTIPQDAMFEKFMEGKFADGIITYLDEAEAILTAN